jgi:uncharacterized protein (DUF1684 family)
MSLPDSVRLRVLGALAAAACLCLTACESGPPKPAADIRPYEDQIMAARAAKDLMFRTDAENSPLYPAERASFTGLPYFPIDPKYHVPASLKAEPKGEQVIIELPTSAKTKDPLRRVGTLGFSIDGQAFTLTAFSGVDDTEMKRLFVPFGDETGGKESYKGGRYLDLERTPTGLYDLDFNRAYHPTCVYNISYICPVPPPENRLPIAIRAGEKMR